MVKGSQISVGIVNFNGESYLMRTLEAVGQLGAVVDEVLLIDNGSTDRSVALVREHFPQLRVIELTSNRGPGAARNRAISEAKNDLVLLVDNDVEPQPGCAEALAAALDAHSNAMLAMPAVLYESDPKTVQYVGAAPHFLGAPALLCADTQVARLDEVVRVVGTVISCCMMVDRKRFSGRRWFTEFLFLYLEDHEFGLRVSLEGYDCLTVPDARCLHRAGTIGVSIRATGRFTPVRIRYTIRNRWLTVLMLYQKRTLLRFSPALAVFELFQLLGAAKKGWIGHWLWAAGSTIRMMPRVLRVRRAMRIRRRRADLEILRGGPFPFNKALHRSALDRLAQRILDGTAQLNWRVAGGRTP